MKRKRLTEVFPWILPMRKKQRTLCFYLHMELDGRQYAATVEKERLPYQLCQTCSPLYNYDTGFDMEYQENKVFNLKLAGAKLDGLLLKPGETFSFWKAVRYADKPVPYRKGLTVVNGALTAAPGGGLCQMSNLLFNLFLHSPLSILERRGHQKKEFPDPGDGPAGIDATVSEGWIDLKAENRTAAAYQIGLDFDGRELKGYLLTDRLPKSRYEIRNGAISYRREKDGIYQKASVYRDCLDWETGKLQEEEKLYDNDCKIEYQLPECVLPEDGREKE